MGKNRWRHGDSNEQIQVRRNLLTTVTVSGPNNAGTVQLASCTKLSLHGKC